MIAPQEPDRMSRRVSPMRTLTLFCSLLLPAVGGSQTTAVAVSQQTGKALQQAMTGDWTGVLEYRDYSEPDTSTKRVKLPTWLTISHTATGLLFHYIYDDGPTKVVDETLSISFDVPGSTLQITNDKGRVETYKVDGYDRLREGRGDLRVLGPTVDNDRPAESRITIGVRRNLLTWTEEVRPTSAVPFAFRHSYVFTRAQAPKLPTP
jgi:hypothetical protein